MNKKSIFFLFIVLVLFFVLISKDEEFINIAEISGINSKGGYSGVSWGDYNNDGFLDLLFKENPKGYRLYKNTGEETFEDVTNKANLDFHVEASNASFGDYNNDGCTDIYVANGFLGESQVGKRDSLFKNNCDGTFTDASLVSGINEEYRTTGIAWADYNNDGFLDIYVSTYGTLHFDKSSSGWTLKNWEHEPNILYHNNGNGTFSNVTLEAGVDGLSNCSNIDNQPKANWQPVWFDFNDDGLQDLYISNETTVNVLYKNNGDGTFADVTESAGLCLAHSTHGVAVGDYNNDGYLDLYVGGTRHNLLYENQGDETFKEVSGERDVRNSGFLAWGVGFLDHNNDGDLDIYSMNGSSENTSVKLDFPNKRDVLYINDGNRFEKAEINVNNPSTFGAFGDFNNDGSTDVFIISDPEFLNESSPGDGLYKNTSNKNNWITIRLIGTKSNIDGIGARIVLKTEEGKQVREVSSGGSLLSQNSLWQTFGLSREDKIEKVEIHWPSGVVQKLIDLPINEIVTVVEASE